MIFLPNIMIDDDNEVLVEVILLLPLQKMKTTIHKSCLFSFIMSIVLMLMMVP